MSQNYGYDGYSQIPPSYSDVDPLLNEIHYLKEKVKSAEEKQTEQEYWNKLLASNIRSGSLACLWCLKAQVLKKLSVAFNRWKYTSIMTNPTNSRHATPLKHRISSSSEMSSGSVSAALNSAMQLVDLKPSISNVPNNEQANIHPPAATPTFHPVSTEKNPAGRSDSNLSIMSSVMDIQYNSANSAHLNKYLQDTLSDKTTDFDTKRKILLAMSNDIIDRGQRERASHSHTPEKSGGGSPHSVQSRQSLSTIRSDTHSSLHHGYSHQYQQQQQQQHVRGGSSDGIAVTDPQQQTQHSSSLHELARTGADPEHHHSHSSSSGSSRGHPHLSLDMDHVGGSNDQPLGASRSRSNSHGSHTHSHGHNPAAVAAAVVQNHTQGYSFNRSPARGRWNESDPLPEHRPAASGGDFKYLVFKNNDSGNYVRELLASPTLQSSNRPQQQPLRSSSASRATARTPPSAATSAAQRGGASVASTGSQSANFVRRSANQAVTTSSSASVSSSRSRHDVRHRINTLETSRLSQSNSSSSSAVPRYMLPTNTYIKKILTPEEAAQFSVIGHNMSGGMNRTAHKQHQQQKSMVSRAARHQHERDHSFMSSSSGGGGGGGGGVRGNDTFNYSGSPYKGEIDHHHSHSPSSSRQQQQQQQQQGGGTGGGAMPYLDSYIPQSERDRRAWPNEPSDTSVSAAIAAAVQPPPQQGGGLQSYSQDPSLSGPPRPLHMSEGAHRVLRQPHFVTAAMENLSGSARPPTAHAPSGPFSSAAPVAGPQQHHTNQNYDAFYGDGLAAPPLASHQQQQQQTLVPQSLESPHLLEYADLIYSSQSRDQHQQQMDNSESGIPVENSQQFPGEGSGGGLFSSYADSRGGLGPSSSSAPGTGGSDGYGFTYSAQRNERGEYVSSAGYHQPSSGGGVTEGGGYHSPGGHYYSHNDYEHDEREYVEEEDHHRYGRDDYHSSGGSGGRFNSTYNSGTYFDEGHDVSSSNASYQSYQMGQSQGGRRVFDMKKKPSGAGGGSVGGGSSKNKTGKKPIDKAQLKLFYGHLMDMKDAKDSWTRTLRM